MHLGPVVIMHSANRRTMDETIARQSQLIAAYSRGTFMHLPLFATLAPIEVTEPDSSERATEAARRVVAAYNLAAAHDRSPALSMWHEIEGRQSEFVTALRDGNVEAARSLLSRMFLNDLTWGLGKVHPSHIEEGNTHFPARTTDALVSLAEAVGVKGVIMIDQQGIEAHRRALDVDVDLLFPEVESKMGFDLSLPPVGSAYGCRIGGKLVSADSLIHSYTAYRLRQLGASASSRIVEIGGGYGCLAMLGARAGFKNYEVFDLPWVNAIQGYFLIMAGADVRLYGEEGEGLRISPHWEFENEAGKSVDFVVNTNSLPELGRETALGYLVGMKRILRGVFLSINQEAKAHIEGVGAQNSVAELVAELGGFRTLSRHLCWTDQGYVEEVYAPA